VKNAAFHNKPRDSQLMGSRSLEMFLSEANCRKFVERNPGLQREATYSIKDVDICDKLNKKQHQTLVALIEEFEAIFAKDDSEPPVMNPKYIKPVDFRLKESEQDSVAHCAKPMLGKNQLKIMKTYRERGQSQGFLTPSTSNFAARVHMTFKPPGPPVKDEIRFAWDFRAANRLQTKLPNNLPNMTLQLQKQVNSKYLTSTDAKKGYHQLSITARTAELLAAWMDDGLYQPNRLVEGAINSGHFYQAAVNRALQHLPDEVREKVSNYLDDFLIGGATFEEYVKNTRKFFEMCKEFNITLHPKKTSLGYSKAKMVGHEVGDGKYTVHEDVLQPLREAVIPGDKLGVQRFLGLTNFARHHVKNYASIAKPLTKLTGKTPWAWTPECTQAFHKLKAAVLEGFPLHTADYSKPFYLFTDASDHGMGAALCQVKGEVKDEDLATLDRSRLQVVAFYSAGFDEAMQRRPVYYREARALIWAMGKAKRHLELSQQQIVLVTDHNPLVWIQHTTRGTVTSWLLEEVAELDFRVVYIPGPTNKEADALSRPPLVSPSVLNATGSAEAWSVLLRKLPQKVREAAKVYVWAGPNTDTAARQVQEWKSTSSAIVRAAPGSMHKQPPQDLLMLAPDPEWSPVVAKQIITTRSDKLRACLVQSDLVNYIAGADGTLDLQCKEEVEQASKIVFLGTNLTWLIFDRRGKKEVISTEAPSHIPSDFYPPPLNQQLELHAAVADAVADYYSVNLDKWKELVREDVKTLDTKYKNKTAKAESGVTLIVEDGRSKVYVPSKLRKGLVLDAHIQSGHAWNLLPTLKSKYAWPSMAKDVDKWTHECSQCPPAKAKHARAHGQFKVTDYYKPRVAYGIDAYEIAKSDAGFVGVITIVDLFTRYVQYIPVQDFKADTATKAILDKVVYTRGAPKTIVSDSAKAFIGKIVSGLCSLLKIKQITTQYYAQGNALTERNHVLLGEALRLMPKTSRATWEKEMVKIAYAVNSTINATTGFSPFELECGVQPNSPGDLLFLKPPSDDHTDLSDWRQEPTTYQGVVENVRLYHDIAKKYSEAKKLEYTKKLNSTGTTRIYEVGDPVIVYVPASSEYYKPKEKDAIKWKPKHCLEWKFGKVVEKLSNARYIIQERYGAKRYTRQVSSMVLDRSSHQDADIARVARRGEVPGVKADAQDFAINDLVAVMEDYEKNSFEIAQIKAFQEEDQVQLHFYGTTSKNINSATFKPVYQDAAGKSMFKKERGAKPWLGTIYMEDILFKIPKLSKNNQLLAETRKRLQKHAMYTLV